MTLQLTSMQKIDEKIKAINEGEQKTTNGIFYLLAIQIGIIKQSRLYRSIKWYRVHCVVKQFFVIVET